MKDKIAAILKGKVFLGLLFLAVVYSFSTLPSLGVITGTTLSRSLAQVISTVTPTTPVNVLGLNSSKAQVTTTGNIGIGTSAPDTLLTIAGNYPTTSNTVWPAPTQLHITPDVNIAGGAFIGSKADNHVYLGSGLSRVGKGNWKVLTNYGAALYSQFNGDHNFFVVPNTVYGTNINPSAHIAMIITENSTVGINLDLPAAMLDVRNSFVSTLPDLLLVASSTSVTGGTKVPVLDVKTDGKVLIGTQTPLFSPASNSPIFQIAGTNGGLAAAYQFSANTTGSALSLAHSRSATVGAQGALQTGDYLGQLSFYGSNGNFFQRGAAVHAVVNGIVSPGVMPTDLVFEAGSSNSFTERMRITSAGNVGIGIVAPQDKLQVIGDIRVGTSGTNGCIKGFGGTALTGTCSSDASLKIVTGNVTGVLEKLSRLDLVTYKWNQLASDLYQNNTNTTNTGYIAQQVQQQFPELVTFDSKGYRQLNYTTLNLYGLQAIKEMNQNLDGIAGTRTPLSGSASESFVSAFFTNIKTMIVAWLADAGNGIGDVFAGTFHAKDKLCINDTCVTEAQLQALIQNAQNAKGVQR